MNEAKIINFPNQVKVKRQPRKRRIKSADGFKYLNVDQIRLLRRVAKEAGDLARARGNKTGVREWALIDLLTSVGLRASEAANLRCGDLNAGYGQSSIFVRCGKNSVSRTVQIPSSLRTHLKSYIRWKKRNGEGVEEDDHLFIGQRGHWTRQGISGVVRKYFQELGFYSPGKASHTLRHSYAMALYRRERDIRALQKQLGHSCVKTTEIYADVCDEDILRQVDGLWNYYC